jgi:hypothetical protein
MEGEISLRKEVEEGVSSGETKPLEKLERAVRFLLVRYETVLKENEDLARALYLEKEQNGRLERKLELLSEDKERVKSRIDQLLHQLKKADR